MFGLCLFLFVYVNRSYTSGRRSVHANICSSRLLTSQVALPMQLVATATLSSLCILHKLLPSQTLASGSGTLKQMVSKQTRVRPSHEWVPQRSFHIFDNWTASGRTLA